MVAQGSYIFVDVSNLVLLLYCSVERTSHKSVQEGDCAVKKFSWCELVLALFLSPRNLIDRWACRLLNSSFGVCSIAVGFFMFPCSEAVTMASEAFMDPSRSILIIEACDVTGPLLTDSSPLNCPVYQTYMCSIRPTFFSFLGFFSTSKFLSHMPLSLCSDCS